MNQCSNRGVVEADTVEVDNCLTVKQAIILTVLSTLFNGVMMYLIILNR